MENNWIHSTATKLADRLNRYAHADGLDYIKMVLGIEIFIINASKLIIIYLLSALFGALPFTLATHFGFLVIKRYSFGLHALSSTVCTAVSIGMFVALPLCFYSAEIGINNLHVIGIFAVIILVLYKFAPADTKARPLVGARNRKRLKKKAVICGVALMVVALLTPNEQYKALFALGAICQSISILPITYKTLKRREKNYESYE